VDNKLFKLLSTTFYHVIIVILISVFGATKEPNLLNYTLLVGIRCAQIIVKKNMCTSQRGKSCQLHKESITTTIIPKNLKHHLIIRIKILVIPDRLKDLRLPSKIALKLFNKDYLFIKNSYLIHSYSKYIRHC
jgi:hypothetical protein